MIYAVIRIVQWYEDIHSVECINSFPTSQEAEDFVQKTKNELNALWKNRIEYIEKYVDDIVIPATDGQGWKEYLKKFHPFGELYVVPSNFKKELKSYLIRYHNAVLENYDPPKALVNMDQLYIVEIKNA